MASLSEQLQLQTSRNYAERLHKFQTAGTLSVIYRLCVHTHTPVSKNWHWHGIIRPTIEVLRRETRWGSSEKLASKKKRHSSLRQVEHGICFPTAQRVRYTLSLFVHVHCCLQRWSFVHWITFSICQLLKSEKLSIQHHSFFPFEHFICRRWDLHQRSFSGLFPWTPPKIQLWFPGLCDSGLSRNAPW